MEKTLFNNLSATIDAVSSDQISDDRKLTLQPLVDYLQAKVDRNEPVLLNFICTHNSRRSHLAQVWAQCMAYYWGIGQVRSFSGGTEATALFPKVAETLSHQGFNVVKLQEEGKNPVYSIKYASNAHPVIGFSKKWDDGFNPDSGFAAIMTCSQADEGCPFIAGAEQRIPVTYDDPKAFDGTPQQSEKYLERSHQIASEMYYVFSKINKPS
ncbi:protein-tyrosine-phosphatase [Echinicola strongylocentroti]|uniref:Protein-tyrosine-phosphatase n=1 Tax=Echinicola strongylocentroti TaxID=1795355 RepID=A0A2Z4IHM5_9BACT|nr:protein-tyrosine-phosphatase [Echinicola strongylocentroti]AWW30622.1 protein-tyrosine-phosphatase [Echinicola strongylocentroti]